jgi:hypothetical protein
MGAKIIIHFQEGATRPVAPFFVLAGAFHFERTLSK